MHKKIAFFVLVLTGLLQASENEGASVDMSISDALALANPTTEKDFKAMKRSWKKDSGRNFLLHKNLGKLNGVRLESCDVQSAIDIEKMRDQDLTFEQRELLSQSIESSISQMNENLKKFIRCQKSTEVLAEQIDKNVLELQSMKGPSQEDIGMDVDSQKKTCIARNKKANKELFEVYKIVEQARQTVFKRAEQAQIDQYALYARNYYLEEKVSRRQAEISEYSPQLTQSLTKFHLALYEDNSTMNKITVKQTQRAVALKEQLQAELSALKEARSKKEKEIVCEEVESKRKKIE